MDSVHFLEKLPHGHFLLFSSIPYLTLEKCAEITLWANIYVEKMDTKCMDKVYPWYKHVH
jgi:hypothetical protein